MERTDVISVGPFAIADLSRERLKESLVSAWRAKEGPVRAYALHVGGMNRWRDRHYVRLLGQAEWLYADGAAAVLVARAGGARSIERAPTTDLGHELLDRLAEEKAIGPVRIALIGGPPGLADRAARRLEAGHPVSCRVRSDGFRTDWETVLDEVALESPDVIFVGMGMPREAVWVAEYLERLPPCLVITCGGWFGFLAGEETRAPAALQRFGMEWVWRLMQSPRLLPRYATGAGTTMALLVLTLLQRLAGRASG